MTNQEILKKAIKEAIHNGWMPYFAEFDRNMTKDNVLIRYTEGASSINFDYEMKGHIVGVGGYNMEPCSIIFNHDFAKSLWGEEWKSAVVEGYIPKTDTYRVGTIEPCWQFHLKAMVVSPDPIKYLGENM